MQERRKQDRKNLSAYSQVYDLEEGTFLGYLGDLTTSGAMVIGEKSMEIDCELTLQMIVPALKGHASRRLSIPARVAWCDLDVSPQFFNLGFEFQDVSEEQRRILEAIIQVYEFNHEQIPQYPYRPASHR